MRNPIIAALDVATADHAQRLAEQIAPFVSGFKVGSELFTTTGPAILQAVRETGRFIFLDLKFHDIPNTVAQAVRSALRQDVRMLTIHAGGGRAMMEAAEAAAQEAATSSGSDPALILGVTVLTSLDNASLGETGCQAHVGRQVERLAQLAVDAGLRGLVCSPLEVTALRQLLPPSIQLVTPGIRPRQQNVPDDQRRTLSPAEAIRAGADFLVVGRPICASPDPAAAAKAILDEVNAGAGK